ncbi:MAG: hypothetical protein WCF85_11140, partial [Rhodospirillaceae bacterium]
MSNVYSEQHASQRPDERKAVHGLVLGKTIDFKPSPPIVDMLGNPLVLRKHPPYELPHDSASAGVCAWLERLGWEIGGERLHRLWRIQAATATVMAAVVPGISSRLRNSGWLSRHGITGRFTIPSFVHPYDFLDIFNTLMRLPEDGQLVRDQRFLELILALCLRQYKETLSQSTGAKFSFDSEANDHFIHGARVERRIKMITSVDELRAAAQELHDAWYHGRNYYIFSIISREVPAHPGKMFILYCHASYGISRITWDGTITDRPVALRLPSRRDLMFLFRRDRPAMQRAGGDETFRAQVKTL